MSISYTLAVYFYIGDEDGPALMMGVKEYTPSKPVYIKNANDKGNYRDATILLHNSDLLKAFKEYPIVDVVEFHDWYDFYSDEETQELQRRVDIASTQPITPDYSLHGLIIIIPYNKDPIKYVLPLEDFNYYKPYLEVLEEGDLGIEKQHILDCLRPYRRNNTLGEIFRNLTITDFTYKFSDEIDLTLRF